MPEPSLSHSSFRRQPWDARALRRAARAMRRLPFRSAFYRRVDSRSLGSRDLSNDPERDTLLFRPLSPARAERLFLLLIRLGVLRREVDGQGLTERVRLTPLGRAVLELWPGEIPRSGLRRWLLDRIAPPRLRP